MAEPEKQEVKRRNRPDVLQRCIRDMDKHSFKAIEALAKLCESEDEKIALEASSKFLKILADMKQQADERDVKTILLQIKQNGGKLLGPPDENIPVVDFENLQDPT